MKLYVQSDKIFLANKAIDFRRGVDGLCAMVIEEVKENPSVGTYIFYNKNLNKIKILGWHNNGFIMIYKRLERGRFCIDKKGGKVHLSQQQLNWLLLGVDWKLLSNIECKYNNYF